MHTLQFIYKKYIGNYTIDLLMLIWIIYSILCGLLISQSWNNVILYLTILSGYFSCRILSIRPKILFCTIMFISASQSLVSIAQFLGYLESYHSLFLVTGSFGNPGQLGCFVAIGIMCTISLLHARNSLSSNIALAVLLTLQILASIISNSRTGWVSIIIGLLFLYYNTNIIKRKYVKVTTCIVVFILFVCLYFYRTQSANGRLFIWRVCIEMVIDKPIFGHGPGGFNKKYMLYQADYFRQNPNSINVKYSDNVSYPYNEFLHILVECGIIGLFLWLAIIVSALVISRKANLYKAPFISFLVLCMFSYPFYVPSLLILFPVLLSAANYNKDENKDSLIRSKILFFIILFCIIVTSKKYVIIHRCNNAVHQLYNASDPIKKQNALCYIESNINTIKNHIFLSDMYAQYVFTHYSKECALSILNEIKAFSPTSEIYCDIGDLYQEIGDINQAISSYTIASYMIPRRIVPKYKLFLLYKDSGDIISAMKYGDEILSSKTHIENTQTLRIKRVVKCFCDNIKLHTK